MRPGHTLTQDTLTLTHTQVLPLVQNLTLRELMVQPLLTLMMQTLVPQCLHIHCRRQGLQAARLGQVDAATLWLAQVSAIARHYSAAVVLEQQQQQQQQHHALLCCCIE